MRTLKTFLFIVFVFFSRSVFAEPIDIYFGPGGGFSPESRNREIRFPDGRVASPTLTQAVLSMIEQTENGGVIKICTYSMSDMDTLEALITACRDRQIQVKLLMDAAANWTEKSRKQILDRVRAEKRAARDARKSVDFQVKVVPAWAMQDRNRSRVLDDGKRIVGTMHEKFGVFYQPGMAVPIHAFCGSANLSYTSDQIYAENRIVFYNCPAVARQLQEEFARLWNEYGIALSGPCKSEAFIPVEPVWGDAAIYFNAEPENENFLTKIDSKLRAIIDQVKEDGGHLDLTMFSLTNPALARYLVYSASAKPKARFRILLDMAQIDDSMPEYSKMGPWMEKEAEKLGLKNFHVKYKWRMNAFGLNSQTKTVELISFKNLFLHHKMLIVNRHLIGMGSYNWSSSAEYMNFENLMVFQRDFPGYKIVVDACLNEFDTIWNSPEPEIPAPEPRKNKARTVSGARGRELMTHLLKLFSDENTRKILESMDKGKFRTFEEIKEESKLGKKDLERRLKALIREGLICKTQKKDLAGYEQAD